MEKENENKQSENTVHYYNRYDKEMFPSKWRKLSSGFMKNLIRAFLDNEEAPYPKCPGELMVDLAMENGYFQQLINYANYESARSELLKSKLHYKETMALAGTPIFCDPHWTQSYLGLKEDEMSKEIGKDFVELFNCYEKYHNPSPRYLVYDESGFEYKFKFEDGKEITVEDRSRFVDVMSLFYTRKTFKGEDDGVLTNI